MEALSDEFTAKVKSLIEFESFALQNDIKILTKSGIKKLGFQSE